MSAKLSTIFCFIIAVVYVTATLSPWMDTNLGPNARALALLSQMTLAEKVFMMHGYGMQTYIGLVPGNSRLGIPPLNMNDGPQGFRDDFHPGTTTSFPSGMTMAATWDPSLMLQWGKAMGLEFFGKGANVQLGPGMNVARVPVNGRNFEYCSGEDPFLGSRMVGPVITGIQSQHVIANAKHWVLNNQETDRTTDSSNVDERTRMEIYYAPFRAAIEAGVGSFMCSYNKIDNTWSCENPVTLSDLKNGAGSTTARFDGWVMSDWGATHSQSVNDGLDQEMPDGDFLGDAALTAAVANGSLSISRINDAVVRMLTPMFAVGLFDVSNTNQLNADVTSAEHTQLACDLSSASTVMLKNERQALPLVAGTTSQPLKVAFFGMAADLLPIMHGQGSGSVTPKFQVSAFAGLRDRFGIAPATRVCDASMFQGGSTGSGGDECRGLWGSLCGTAGFSYDRLTQQCYLKRTNDGSMPNPTVTSGPCGFPAQWQCNAAQSACVAVADGRSAADVQRLLDEATVAVVVVATVSGEGWDRPNLALSPDQDALVHQVIALAKGKKVIAVVSTPGAVLLPWSDVVDTILVNFMPGQEAGHAIADILLGRVNPSARLPVTFPNKDNEMDLLPSQYPGINLESNYSEALLVGYRWYTASGVQPKFAFGHGIGYSAFSYDAPSLQVEVITNGDSVKITATINISNVGLVHGAEVAQLYLTYPTMAEEPPLQLRGFVKTGLLAPGQTQLVQFDFGGTEMSIWDVQRHGWVVIAGQYAIHVGASSADLRASLQFSVTV